MAVFHLQKIYSII